MSMHGLNVYAWHCLGSLALSFSFLEGKKGQEKYQRPKGPTKVRPDNLMSSVKKAKFNS